MTKIFTAALAVVVAGSAGIASAQPRNNDHDRRDDRRDDNRYEARRDHDDRRDDRQQRRYNAGRYQAPAGYRVHRWTRGERLPQSYRSRAYYVDYSRYGLRAPPRGYQYVRVGNDVVLTALATGLVASVVANLFQ